MELKWSEHSRPAHRFGTASHRTITYKFTKFYILINVMKFNRYSFSSIKGSFIPSLLQSKTCVPTSKSQPPTRPDPTCNLKPKSGRVGGCISWLPCDINSRKVMQLIKIWLIFIWDFKFFNRSLVCLLVGTHRRTVAQKQCKRTWGAQKLERIGASSYSANRNVPKVNLSHQGWHLARTVGANYN